jgi:hypothetical protein
MQGFLLRFFSHKLRRLLRMEIAVRKLIKALKEYTDIEAV